MYSSYIAKLGRAQHKRTFCNCALMCQLLSCFWCIWWYNTSGFDAMMKNCQNSEKKDLSFSAREQPKLYSFSEQNNPFSYWPVSSTKTSLQVVTWNSSTVVIKLLCQGHTETPGPCQRVSLSPWNTSSLKDESTSNCKRSHLLYLPLKWQTVLDHGFCVILFVYLFIYFFRK